MLNDFLIEMHERVASLERMLHNMFLVGTIVERSPDSRTYKVKVSESLTISAALQMSVGAGEFSSRFPFSAGDRVFVASPGGDLSAAVILGSLELKENKEEVSGHYYVKLPGGGIMRWDGKGLTLTAPENGFMIKGKTTITGETQITGETTITGGLKVSKNVKAAGEIEATGNVFGKDVVATATQISLGTHFHSPLDTQNSKATTPTAGAAPAPTPEGD